MGNYPDINRFIGCILGLSLGDALGAPFEGESITDLNTLDEMLKCPPDLLRYTDDTEMAIGLTETLINGFTPEGLADSFVRNFNQSRGYGRGTVAIIQALKCGDPWHKANVSVFKDGSFGNGAAMRVAPLGLRHCNRHEDLIESVYRSCIVTHTHPLAIEGAIVIAKATALAVTSRETNEILLEIRGCLREKEYIRKADEIREFLKTPPSPPEAARQLGNSVKADMSVPSALLAFLLYGSNFTGAVRYAIGMGGDTDTIAAMTGAMAGAQAGVEALPKAPLSVLEERGKLESLARALYDITMKDS